MRLSKRGMYRDHGPTELIRPTDGVTVRSSTGTPAELIVRTDASRGDESSYHYLLRFSTTEVLRYLLTLPADTIPEAMEELKGEFDLSEVIPELQRQLCIGAFATV